MDGSHEGSASSSPAPFLTKTYEMVNDPATDGVVSWSSTSSSFVVWKPLEFARDLLPKYFKHSNFSSFVRQLNTYGFRKVDPDQWEFANEEFVRGQRHLLKNIHRRKPVHSHSLPPNAPRHLAEDEKHELEEEIEKLRREKGTLILELGKHSQQQHGMERQMQCLEERLQSVEQRQRDIVSFLGKIAQRPGFLSDLLYKSNLHHKRRLPKLDYLFQDANVEDNQIVAFETMSIEKHNNGCIQIFDAEPFDKIDSCISSLEAFFFSAIDATVGSMCYDDGIPSPSKLLHSCPCLEDTHSSSGLVEFMSHVVSENQKGGECNVLEMDVKSEPSVHETHSSMNQATKATTVANDVFWEQFLTETPASSETLEAQSECKDVKDDKRNLER